MRKLPTDKARGTSRSAGFTIIEVVIAMSVFALIAVNIGMITRSGATAAKTGTLLSVLNDELNLTVERMELALMGAHAEQVESVQPSPLYSNRVDFAIDVGMDGGEVILGDPERIEWRPTDDDTGRVSWLRNPGDVEEERVVTWSRSVPTLQKDELGGNGADDNENGLFDEEGLAFTRPSEQMDMIEIHLTVERTDQHGDKVGDNRVRRVTCRN